MGRGSTVGCVCSVGPGARGGRRVAVGGRRRAHADALPAQRHRRALGTGLGGTLLLVRPAEVTKNIIF